ncbi:hypothetical protein M0R45_015421 [Rubus argutus]|uniref:Uncharacterized protein n=1 Tax=Rubus argutus TaxID=59490 RepID=A0AAW1XRM9_RUBAR
MCAAFKHATHVMAPPTLVHELPLLAALACPRLVFPCARWVLPPSNTQAWHKVKPMPSVSSHLLSQRGNNTTPIEPDDALRRLQRWGTLDLLTPHHPSLLPWLLAISTKLLPKVIHRFLVALARFEP